MIDEPNPYAPPQSRIEVNVPRVPRSRYPWWVKASLWGVPGRAGLWVFVALSLAAAAGCIVYGFQNRRSSYAYASAAFLFGAWIYWQSIRWIDRHGSWTDDAR